MSDRQSIPVPVVTDHYGNIYNPQEDVFTLAKEGLEPAPWRDTSIFYSAKS